MYKIIKTISYGKEYISIIRDNGNEQYTSFSADPDNTDYQAYLKWVSEGGQVLPADSNA
jgi:predicted metalloendopeptidase